MVNRLIYVPKKLRPAQRISTAKIPTWRYPIHCNRFTRIQPEFGSRRQPARVALLHHERHRRSVRSPGMVRPGIVLCASRCEPASRPGLERGWRRTPFTTREAISERGRVAVRERGLRWQSEGTAVRNRCRELRVYLERGETVPWAAAWAARMATPTGARGERRSRSLQLPTRGAHSDGGSAALHPPVAEEHLRF
jgi:hypothetical protein